MKKRIPFKERLEALGINQKDFDYYWDTFIIKYSWYWKRRSYKTPWYYAKKKGGDPLAINKYSVIGHLSESHWISKQMPPKTNYFVIDVDSDHKVPIRNRYDQIVSFLPHPLVIQSSKSRGLHLILFFRRNGVVLKFGRNVGYNI